MNCEQANQLLSDFYDGELKEPLVSQVAAHVTQCSDCTSVLANFEAIGEMLKSNKDGLQSASVSAPTWNQFEASLKGAVKNSPTRTAGASRQKLKLVFAAVLAASIVIWVSLNAWMNSNSITHKHDHLLAGDSAVVIDFEKLLSEESNQPIATLVSLSSRFEGQLANLDESETQLGYKPSISQAMPGELKVVSNRILKLPRCNCESGACTCGPVGCNCAASLCKRADGSEFLVVEHCATQNVSFGNLKSEVIQDGKNEIQMMSNGTQFVASWIESNRRLTAIGLHDKAEVQAIVASIAAR